MIDAEKEGLYFRPAHDSKEYRELKEEIGKRSFYHSVYNILVSIGASRSLQDDFVRVHAEGVCDEWRFMGIFGMSGKYWRERNEVTGPNPYAHEPTSKEQERELDRVNKALKELTP